MTPRLKCGDGAVWEHITHVDQRTEERLANLCLTSLCGGLVKCGLACLNHIHTLPEKHRSACSPFWLTEVSMGAHSD